MFVYHGVQTENVVIHQVSIIPTPGHTGRDVSVLVKGTVVGQVLVAGDLFESSTDEDSWRELSENPEVQYVSRQNALRTADVIIPGHGVPFRVFRELGDWGPEIQKKVYYSQHC